MLQPVFRVAQSRGCYVLTLGTALWLGGCQVAPQPVLTAPPPTTIPTPSSSPAETVTAATTQPVKPVPELAAEPLETQRLPNGSAPSRPVIVPLPQPAPRGGVRRDGHNIPAFNGLLTIARDQIAQAKWEDAEQTLTRAQRMAPDSPAVYAYFAEIAIKRQQWNRAESMARRGLLLTQNPAQQRTFWQIVLLSAQQQNHPRSIQEAQRQLSQLR